MTVMAVNPQVRAGTGSTPARTVGARGAKSVPPAAAPPAPRRRQIALTPMRSDTAKSLRRLAAHVQGTHPDMPVHQHLRDAARVLESGNEEGAQRHLRAAMFALTPQSLLRNGVHDDPGHLAAREAMHGVHRHLLLVKDIQDAGEKNRAAIAKHAAEDMTTSPPPPAYGGDPGALAQKPVARQPGGDRALNAPARTNSGGSDPAVADPVGPQPRGGKQFARSWDEVSRVIEMAATLTKEQAHYRPGGVPGHRCGDCTMIRGDRCTLVEGLIDPGHVCDHFDAAGASLAITWDDLASVVELSARTAQLEVTPAPYGKPGGPGLYGVAGQKHSDYFEQVVQALIRKRGMSKGQASAVAYGALRKWRAKSKHPEVRAAATGALAEEATKHGSHGHANTWDDLASVIEMAAAAAVPGQQLAAGQPAGSQQSSPAKSANATAQPRVGAGSPAGGQFAPPGSGGGSGGKQPMDAHQQHVAHLQHLATHGTPAQQAAAKALLAKMAAPSKGKTTSKSSAAPKTKTTSGTAPKSAAPKATSKATTSTAAPKTASTSAAKPAGSTKTATAKTSTSKTAAKATAGKAASSKTASATAKAAAHKAHLAHVAHLQHLATHGNPAQKKAALAVLARLGVKP